MTQPDLIALVGQALSGLGSQGGGDPFHATLKLGEIIRGRVMRSIGDGRYAVNFQGHERVVDSTIPLRTDDILHGRVVAVGDRVELQRVRVEAMPAQRADTPALPEAQAAPGGWTEVRQLLAAWPAAEQAALARLAAVAGNDEAVLLAARAVARSGLPPSSALVQVVYAALAQREAAGVFALRSDAVELASSASAGAQQPAAGAAAVTAFAELLKASFDASRQCALPPARPADDDDIGVEPSAADGAQQGSGAAADAGLAAAFFNAQTGGAVAHAVTTIPLIVDGHLVELDIAMFGEPRGGAGAMPHGRVVIELDTEHLGHLHIDANLVGSHVQVGIASDNPDAADFIAQHAGVLRSRIQDDGWSVDGLRYEVRERGAVNGVARIVLEHRVSADSLSRLV